MSFLQQIRSRLGRVAFALFGPNDQKTLLESVTTARTVLHEDLKSLTRHVAGLEKLVATQADSLSRLKRDTTELTRQRKVERQWRRRMNEQLSALLRDAHVSPLIEDETRSLIARRFPLLSQNQEDGIVLALLRMFGTQTKTFVEIGCGSNGGNSGVLSEDLGWQGLMVDIHPERAAQCARRFTSATCVCLAVSPENINQLLEENGFVGEVDIFSLDIDSVDYWVLEAMTACSPRILALEYNADFGPDLSVTVPRDAPLESGFKGYQGASLVALDGLARKKGYRLMVCDYSGTNAFFARNDVRPDISGVSPRDAYRAPLDRDDPFGERRRETVDVVAEAEKRGLPLCFL